MITYGSAIRELRKGRRETLKFAAKLIGISDTYLQKIEMDVYLPSQEVKENITKWYLSPRLEVQKGKVFVKLPPPPPYDQSKEPVMIDVKKDWGPREIETPVIPVPHVYLKQVSKRYNSYFTYEDGALCVGDIK